MAFMLLHSKSGDAFHAIDSDVFTRGNAQVLLSFRFLATGRRFVVAEKGYIGWCPETCILEDVISVLEGKSVPIVLKPGIDEEHYTISDDAYIRGLVDGEAFEMCAKSDIHAEGIVLV
jgi:hypothetical protein